MKDKELEGLVCATYYISKLEWTINLLKNSNIKINDRVLHVVLSELSKEAAKKGGLHLKK